MENRTLLIRLGVGSLLLLIVLAAGCLLGWIVFSFASRGTSPAELATEYKEDYTVLVGAAYACDHDLAKAQARLDLLGFPNSAQWVAQVTEAYILEGGDECDIASLVGLSDALGMSSASMIAYLPTITPLPTSTWPPTPVPTATSLPSPTATPSATPIVPPTALPTERPTDMPTVAQPTDTAAPPTETPAPADTAKPAQPTNTPQPKPTNTPAPPTQPPIDFVVTHADLVPWAEGGCCNQGLVRVQVLDVDGEPLDGVHVRFVWTHKLSGIDLTSGDKGPGLVELVLNSDGEQVTLVSHVDGRSFTSETSRVLQIGNPPPSLDDLLAANCCAGEAASRQQQMDDCLSGDIACGHWDWFVQFQATHRIRP
ncbi:hypothetical protein ACFLWA_00210 [Chloroflexota bacterium]